MPPEHLLHNVPAAIVARAADRHDLDGLRRDAIGSHPYALVALPNHGDRPAGDYHPTRHETVDGARAALAAGRQNRDPQLSRCMVMDLRSCLPLLDRAAVH